MDPQCYVPSDGHQPGCVTWLDLTSVAPLIRFPFL